MITLSIGTLEDYNYEKIRDYIVDVFRKISQLDLWKEFGEGLAFSTDTVWASVARSTLTGETYLALTLRHRDYRVEYKYYPRQHRIRAHISLDMTYFDLI